MMPRHRFFHVALLVLATLLLSACAETQLASHYAKQMTPSGSYKVGNPYKVANVWYYPKEDFTLVETGIASWYGPDFHGKKTANGETYNQNELTAAHRTLPMPSLVRVTNLENGRSLVVRINDRGPFLHGRVIDLSKRGAELLGYQNKGTARVRLEVLTKESRQIAEAAKRGMDTSRMTSADLDRMGSSGSVQVMSNPPPVQEVAYRSGNMPESLQTPTITVEELSAPPGRAAPVVSQPRAETVKGHMSGGHFMPDPVVSTVPVQPTGIFVQAGSFSLRDNAVRLQDKLSSIASAHVDPVMVNGRQMYRVKLGPVATVAEADKILSRVVSAGNGGAKVIRD